MRVLFTSSHTNWSGSWNIGEDLRSIFSGKRMTTYYLTSTLD
jgi:hypothetical protein